MATPPTWRGRRLVRVAVVVATVAPLAAVHLWTFEHGAPIVAAGVAVVLAVGMIVGISCSD